MSRQFWILVAAVLSIGLGLVGMYFLRKAAYPKYDRLIYVLNDTCKEDGR